MRLVYPCEYTISPLSAIVPVTDPINTFQDIDLHGGSGGAVHKLSAAYVAIAVIPHGILPFATDFVPVNYICWVSKPS